MYKMNLPVDDDIDKAVERRRSAEAARKARVFNTRLRVIGLDVDALNQQITEKKHQQEVERLQNKAADERMKSYGEQLLQQDRDEKEKRASLHTELTQYWATQQCVKDSPDADFKFNLKGAYKPTIPESSLGPASMQIFKGEGIGEEQKRKAQMQMTERDLRAQKEDYERRCMAEKHKEMLVSKELMRQDLKALQLDKLEECKRAARIALDNFNQALAAQQAENLKDNHRREQMEDHADIWHTLTSDMMTEGAVVARTKVGGGRSARVLTDRWKGMSPEELSAIHREREAQCVERQKQRDAEKVLDAAWHLQQLRFSREAEEEEKKQAGLRAEMRIQMDQYNMHLAKEQQIKQEYLNKKVYTNKPTKDYFLQFNTSSR
ncbi:RIB43A-like with coiled-coils protein 1 [Thalassophryne amazonica]|uniref:RIB43A-like with coiled-coils protein 1 n=1 Tax=Thalassophryne amazonica TaxID=390379 RepID=UPI0014717328|nr:RIB43A-like with coiled-coils protein 1 [Thalassophryne amazonica]